MTKGRRIDVVLVEAGFFESRSKASAAIAAGLVTADGLTVSKPSELVRPDSRLAATAAHPWVSRGGVKLVAGLDAFSIDPAGKWCLDLGASTGGFTQVLLSRGAAHVLAVDVGRDQLHPDLRVDHRVTNLESRDARGLDLETLGRPFDLMVCDVSFISLKLVLPPALVLAARNSSAVILVKPQFEAGPGTAKRGIIRDPAVHDIACRDIVALVEGLGWRILGLRPSPIEGGDGNREFLLGARRDDG